MAGRITRRPRVTGGGQARPKRRDGPLRATPRLSSGGFAAAIDSRARPRRATGGGGRGERRRSPRRSMSAERGQQPVGQREQDEAREDRPTERGTAPGGHFRNQVGRRHLDRDAGGHGE